MNLRLVQEREIGDVEVMKLNALHYAMDAIIEDETITNETTQEAVLYLEYIMQSLWKFPEQSSFHTHCLRVIR